MKKNITWNIRRLVDDSFVPSSKRPSVLYCKLTDYRWLCENERLSAILSIYELFVIYLSELIFFCLEKQYQCNKMCVIGYNNFFPFSIEKKNQAKDLDFFFPPIPSVNYVFHASISNKTSRLMKKVCDSLIDWWKKNQVWLLDFLWPNN